MRDHRAAAIRAERCSWWWSIHEESADGQARTRDVCGAAYLPLFLRAMGMDIERAAGTVTRDQRELSEMTGAFREALAAAAVARLAPPVRVVRELGERTVDD